MTTPLERQLADALRSIKRVLEGCENWSEHDVLANALCAYSTAEDALAAFDASAQGEWQPISTAPRDNTRIIIWHEGTGDACIAWWTEGSFWCQGAMGRGFNRTYPDYWLCALPKLPAAPPTESLEPKP